ncbi:MAG: DUF2269 family protein [Alphaproteobacteria bacterium]|nr:DUF2269 family protein [Alphaproteobacteria bacterium]
MTYTMLRLVHLIGAVLLGAGLVGVFVSDLRARAMTALALYAESVRAMAVFYDGLVVPGALLLAGSGTWLIVEFHGWTAFEQPWLAGMIALFLFEFVEGNTVTRAYIVRMRRLAGESLAQGRATPALLQARGAALPTFTHFLDLPLFATILALGVVRPQDWATLAAAVAIALAVAVALTLLLPRLYPGDPLGAAA